MSKKKLITFMTCLIIACTCAGIASACGGSGDTSSASSSLETSSSASSSDTPSVVEYKVTFNTIGGSDVKAQVVKNGEKASKPTDPTRDGYTFVEWQLNGKTYNFESVVTRDMTLTAKWEKKTAPKFTVSFVVDGETEAFHTAEVESGKKLMLPANTPIREGYIFDAWTLEGVAYDFETPVTSDMTLTAKWAKAWTVTFDVGEGSAVDPITVKEGDKVSAPTTTLDGYFVSAWLLKGESYDFATPVTSDITLTAVWTECQIKIKVDGEENSLYNVGDTLSLTIETNLSGAPVWSSSDETVATVDNGIVTMVGGGEAMITVTIEGASVSKTVSVFGNGLYDDQIGIRINGWNVSSDENYLSLTTDANGEMVATTKFQANANWCPALILTNIYSKGYYEALVEKGYVNLSFNLTVEGDLADVYVFGKKLDAFPENEGVYEITIAIQHLVNHYETISTIATSDKQVGTATSLAAKLFAWKSPADDWSTVRDYVVKISNAKFGFAPTFVEVAFTEGSEDMIDVGGSTALSVTSDWDEKYAVWSSSDPEVATVDKNGVVTGLKGGEVTITATIAGVSASKTVYVFSEVLNDSQIGARINGWNMSGNTEYFNMETGDNGEMVVTAKFNSNLDYYPMIMLRNLCSKEYYEKLQAKGYTSLVFNLAVEGDVTDLYVLGKALNTLPQKDGVYTVVVDVQHFITYYATMDAIATSGNQVGSPSSLNAMLIAWKHTEWNVVRDYVFTISNAAFCVAPTFVEVTFADGNEDMIEIGGNTTLNVTSDWGVGNAVWSSSDETIATVENGVVTGLKGGEVTITATVAGVSASKTVYVVGGLNDNQIGARINGWNMSGNAEYFQLTTGESGKMAITAKFQANETYSPALIFRNICSKEYYEKLIANGYTKLTFALAVEGDVTDLYVFGKQLTSFAKSADGVYAIVVEVQHIVNHYDIIYTIATSGNQVGQSSSLAAKLISWKSPTGDWSTARGYVFTISNAAFRKDVLFSNDIGMRINGWNMTTNTTYMTMETGENGEMVIGANFQANATYSPALILRNIKEKAYYEGLIESGYTKLAFDLKVEGDVTDLYVFGKALTNFEKSEDGVYAIVVEVQHIVNYYDTINTIATSGNQVGQSTSLAAKLISWKSPANDWSTVRSYVFTISNAAFIETVEGGA